MTGRLLARVARHDALRAVVGWWREPRVKALRATLAVRRLRFRAMSTHPRVFEEARVIGPTLVVGRGVVRAQGCQLGYWPSPAALDSYIHIEARRPGSSIEIGPETKINNGCVFIAEASAISIGRSVLIGPGVSIFDSDFHALVAEHRKAGTAAAVAPVIIGDQVFIGAGAIVLKGVTIGERAVIGAGAVVSTDVLADSIVAGNPARPIARNPIAPPTGGNC